MATVSVVIPVFNGETVIEETLLNLLGQSLRDWHCILINDGSDDRSLEIIQNFIGLNGNYSFEVHSTPNLGPSNARNLGISLASTQFVAFLDQDDAWHSEKLTLQVNFLNNHLDHSGVLCDFEIVKNRKAGGSRNGRVIRNSNLNELARGWVSLEGNGAHLSSGFVYRKDFKTTSMRFNPLYKHVADLDFFLRFHKDFKIGYVPLNLVSYSQHSNQMHIDPTLLKYEYPLLLSEIDFTKYSLKPKRVLGNVFAMSALLDLKNRNFATAYADIVTAFYTNPFSILIVPIAIFRKRIRGTLNFLKSINHNF